MILRLGEREARRILDHLRDAYPAEGCGVLLGHADGDVRSVVRVVPVTNRSKEPRPDRYRIDPADLLAAETEGRAAGLDVIGFFHSHPDAAATPSAIDLERAWPYYAYLIVGIDRGEVGEARVWRLAADRSRFEPATLSPDPVPSRSRDAASAEDTA